MTALVAIALAVSTSACSSTAGVSSSASATGSSSASGSAGSPTTGGPGTHAADLRAATRGETLKGPIGSGRPITRLSPQLSAHLVTVADRRGDGPASIDITQAGLANVGDLVGVRIRVAHLDWNGQFAVSLSAIGDREASLYVDLIALPDHTTVVHLADGDYTSTWKSRCGPADVGTQYDPTTDMVLLEIPRSCIPAVGKSSNLEWSVNAQLADLAAWDDMETLDARPVLVQHVP